MVRVIKKDREYYQCEACGLQFIEMEWAEKCEAWCRGNQSCNIEITAHAAKSENESEEKSTVKKSAGVLTALFYGSIGLAASLGLALTFYWSLRLNTGIIGLVTMTRGVPLYFWPYVLLTLGTVALFGVNLSLIAYRWRRFGPPTLVKRGGVGAGAIVGTFASACPVCGATLLSAVGVAGGLAAFPLYGLELKALSFGLMVLALWLSARDSKEAGCSGGACPSPRDASFRRNDLPWFLAVLALIAALAFVSWGMLKPDLVAAGALHDDGVSRGFFEEAVAAVQPEGGFKSRIVLGDSVVRLVELGVIDREKFEALYGGGGLPGGLRDVLTKPSSEPILLTEENANVYLNLLWPLGLANYMPSNEESPMNGSTLFNFASTGGWTLGREENGGAYFNRFRIVELTQEEEALVVKIAQRTYRPCCNNPTLFQDCNHGSALLGLLELGASQGLTEEELYREALAFNSFWFPRNYVATAIYFKAVKNTDWKDVDPRLVMSMYYSSVGGWYTNVYRPLSELDLLPQARSGAGCGA